ncbi:MAG: serine/threonine protein kinase [Oscillospiraceae bacterium]|nr:serine/threonine protein kinase [Oscillospiraceae bacterium]
MTLENEYILSFYQELSPIEGRDNMQLVRHSETGRLYVKKTLALYDREVFDFIRRERPDGVPAIEALVEQDGVLTVVEDYIAGERVSELLARQGRLDEAQAVNILCQLCDILAIFHRRQPPIVHRDIKPQNMMLPRDGRLGLLDCHAAQVSRAEAGRDTVLIGTAGYAAPEQYGFSPSTPATDIYAAGILLTELVTGARDTAALTGHLGAVAHKCTAMEPSRRYTSMGQLKRALRYRSPDSAGWLPPGFRTKNPWKTVTAIAGYLLMLDLAATLEMDGPSSPVYTIAYRVGWGLAELLMVLVAFNYRNVWARLPLTRNRRLWVRLLGAALYCAGIFALYIFLMAVVQTVLGVV